MNSCKCSIFDQIGTNECDFHPLWSRCICGFRRMDECRFHTKGTVINGPHNMSPFYQEPKISHYYLDELLAQCSAAKKLIGKIFPRCWSSDCSSIPTHQSSYSGIYACDSHPANHYGSETDFSNEILEWKKAGGSLK